MTTRERRDAPRLAGITMDNVGREGVWRRRNPLVGARI